MGKRVLVTGGTGFIGTVLCRTLLDKGYELTVLSRQTTEQVQSICGEVQVVNDLDQLRSHPGYQAVINLAGESIAGKRWTNQRKQTLRDSRIALTNTLINVIQSWDKSPEVLVSGSAVGFYGDQGSKMVTEDTPARDEFSHRLCRDWENAALSLETSETRVCLSRTGLVVGPEGGFLQRMTLPFKLGLGGRMGNGQQYMPWVHREDVVACLIWMLETTDASGAYNVVSPSPVSNREFTRCLARVLRRPAIFPAPAPVLKIALGEMARLLLTGQQAHPKRLTDAGFRFRFPGLEEALDDAVT